VSQEQLLCARPSLRLRKLTHILRLMCLPLARAAGVAWECLGALVRVARLSESFPRGALVRRAGRRHCRRPGGRRCLRLRPRACRGRGRPRAGGSRRRRPEPRRGGRHLLESAGPGQAARERGRRRERGRGARRGRARGGGRRRRQRLGRQREGRCAERRRRPPARRQRAQRRRGGGGRRWQRRRRRAAGGRAGAVSRGAGAGGVWGLRPGGAWQRLPGPRRPGRRPPAPLGAAQRRG